MTLATEIGLVKTEIASSLSASLYTAKDLVYVAKAIEALANAETTTGAFETVDVSSILYVGPNADTFNTAAGLTNPVIVAQSNYNDYSQIAFKNTNSGANASTDIMVTLIWVLLHRTLQIPTLLLQARAMDTYSWLVHQAEQIKET
jgi:ethanolamine ammonia-lyase large subunit